MLVPSLFVIAGLAALFQGGDALVGGASAMARRFGVPPLLVGLTIVAFATSAPELAVSIIAASMGTPDIAVGNVLGSNIFNVLMAVGLVAVLIPLAIQPVLFRREIPFCAVATLLVLAFGTSDGLIGRGEGLILLTLLVGFLSVVIWRALASRGAIALDDEDEDEIERDGIATFIVLACCVGALAMSEQWGWGVPALALASGLTFLNATFASERMNSLGIQSLTLLLSLGLLVLGSDLLVEGARELASMLGVSEAVVGLTIVAVGTSAPELATSLMAARKGQDDIAVGNALGSNLFNILGVLSLTALVHPIRVGEAFLSRDIWVALASVLILLPFWFLGRRIGRPAGALFVLGWTAYTALLVTAELSGAG